MDYKWHDGEHVNVDGRIIRRYLIGFNEYDQTFGIIDKLDGRRINGVLVKNYDAILEPDESLPLDLLNMLVKHLHSRHSTVIGDDKVYIEWDLNTDTWKVWTVDPKPGNVFEEFSDELKAQDFYIRLIGDHFDKQKDDAIESIRKYIAAKHNA
jgi:hypothetical protein